MRVLQVCYCLLPPPNRVLHVSWCCNSRVRCAHFTRSHDALTFRLLAVVSSPMSGAWKTACRESSCECAVVQGDWLVL